MVFNAAINALIVYGLPLLANVCCSWIVLFSYTKTRTATTGLPCTISWTM